MYQISDSIHSEDTIKSIVQYLSDAHNLKAIRVYDKSNKESWLFRNIKFNQEYSVAGAIEYINYALGCGMLVYADISDDQLMLMKLSI